MHRASAAISLAGCVLYHEIGAAKGGRGVAFLTSWDCRKADKPSTSAYVARPEQDNFVGSIGRYQAKRVRQGHSLPGWVLTRTLECLQNVKSGRAI
jgi:hypothetical protein